VDIQGVELRALKGLGSRITEFNWIYTEVNKSEVYRGCSLVEDLDIYLARQGFKRISTRWEIGKGWGDAIYANEKVNITYLMGLKAASANLKWITRQIREKVQISKPILRIAKKLIRLIVE
jgi:hypothetical protein